MPTALITGAASGIGLATAHHLARDGVHLILIDRDAAALITGATLVSNGGYTL